MMKQPTHADEWIELLSLQPHPEGGYYREVFRSSGTIQSHALPAQFRGARSFVTSIYFLLRSAECSRYHRLRSDELWYFHAGSPLILSIISPSGVLTEQRLGFDIRSGESLQSVVQAESWFAARVDVPDSYSLISCAVAPGFDFADFEMGKQEDLVKQFPNHKNSIMTLT